MKKFGEFFVYAAILLVLVIGGCDIPVDLPPEAAADPTLSPPPVGRVWVKIPLPDDGARTLTGTNNLAYIDYYEVIFLKRDKTSGTIEEDYSAVGSARFGEILAVSVYPDVTYEVLLLAGHYKTRTLMASSYNGEVPIVSGKVNQVDLQLMYITSDPLTDLKFDYSGSTPNTSPKVTSTSYYELPGPGSITISTAGSSYVINDRLKGEGTMGDLPAVIKVTGVDVSGGITGISVENKGWFASSGQAITWTNISGSGSSATFALTLVAQTDNIPATIPWLSYINDGINDLTFGITTKGLEPLINAGGSGGAGSAEFELVKVDLKLIPYTGSFTPVSDSSTTPTPILGTDDISLSYTFVNAALPSTDTNAYGLLYYILQYKAFGGDLGSPWTIRNGITLNELDKGELSPGAGVLVKIGNPGKFTPKVEAVIPIP